MKNKNEKNTKVFVDQDGVAVIECPVCSLINSKHVDSLAIREHNIRDSCTVRCKCRTKFVVTLDFRKDSRKPTYLSGEYICLPKGKTRGELKVVDIARNGFGLEVSAPNQFKIGDELLVLFNLDDKNATLIEKRAKIKFVKEDFVGCEFVDSFRLGKALRDYLENESNTIDQGGGDQFDWDDHYYK